jgi:hypothetical protein
MIPDIRNYLDNFTKKASGKQVTEEFIKNFHKRAKNIRNATNILSVAALSAFLVIIPKLYKTDKNDFPGLDGLNTGKNKKLSKQPGGVNDSK